jgi:hypothetical protein
MIADRKWTIITLSNYTDEELENLVSNAIQTSVNTLRKTLDDNKALLKWDGDTPSCFDGLTIYSREEIKVILNGSDWINTDE